MADHSALLTRFKPRLCYDSQEAFVADSAEMMCAWPGCTLRHAPPPDGDGMVLAGGSGNPALTLDLLGERTYEDDGVVAATDLLALGTKSYRTMYVKLRRERGDLCNRIYGRGCRDGDGRLWLQYWFFYVYNDYHLAANFGLHEGDWEMIQIRLKEDDQDAEGAVYAQHDYAEERQWSEVAKPEDRPDTPLVFVGRGSHASYFEPGVYGTEAWFDIAEGDGFAPELALEVVDGGPPWTLWPGVWGATRARVKKLESDSPGGPSTHDQWEDPAKLVAKAANRPAGAVRKDAESPNASLTARRLGRRLLVRCDASGFPADDPPDRLVVTVNSREEHTMPPRTFTFSVGGRRPTSFVAEQVVLDPEKPYDVDLSVTTASGLPSKSVKVAISPQQPPPGATLKGELALIGIWVRERLRSLVDRE